jgi:hypothetical protein
MKEENAPSGFANADLNGSRGLLPLSTPGTAASCCICSRSPLALTAAAPAHYPRATQTDAGNPEGGEQRENARQGGAHTGTETPHNGPPRPANRRTASEQPHQKP